MTRILTRNHEHFRRAIQRLPLGVASNFRYWGEDRTIYVKQGRGARITDLDDNIYIDYRMGYGPAILGYADPRVDAAAREGMDIGGVFALSTERELRVADRIASMVPTAELVRFSNSGTEAVMAALRLARGNYIIQCCVSDGFLASTWFGKCVDILEREKDISLVWALPQYMSEEGALLRVAYQDFLEDPPPQREDFLPFWLATKFVLPEGNYCARSDVLRENFPDERAKDHYKIQCHLGFMYNFMTRGYCPLFVPEVVSFGRLHAGQRGQRLQAAERPAFRKYVEDVLRRAIRSDPNERFHSAGAFHAAVRSVFGGFLRRLAALFRPES